MPDWCAVDWKGVKMPQYRRKPIVIEAQQWFPPGDERHDPTMLIHRKGNSVNPPDYRQPNDLFLAVWGMGPDIFMIRTPAGDAKVFPGDWIVTDVDGGKTPICDRLFNETYEPHQPMGWTPPAGISIGDAAKSAGVPAEILEGESNYGSSSAKALDDRFKHGIGLIFLACCLLSGCSRADASPAMTTPVALVVTEIAFASLTETPNNPNPKPGVCPNCDGKGRTGDGTHFVTCLECNGTGRIGEMAYAVPSADCHCQSCECKPCRCDGLEAYREALESGEPLLVACEPTEHQRTLGKLTAAKERRRYVEVRPFKNITKGTYRFPPFKQPPMIGPGQPQAKAPNCVNGNCARGK